MGKIIPNENSWIGFAPNLVGVALAAPAGPSATPSATGGTLGAGTQYYKVTSTSATGETTPGAEVNAVTTGTTASVVIAWTAVAGATGYKIYKGATAGGENRLLTTIVGQATATFTDTTPNAGVAGSPPSVNTTGSQPGVSLTSAPSSAEIAGSVDLTGFVISITAQTTGNIVPVPTLKTKFETSIQGTYGASFTADMYRDDATDTAWAVLPRNTKGFFIISRFGGRSTAVPGLPITGDVVEVWPIIVVARSASNLASNTAEMFTLTCSVPTPPNEGAVVGV